MSKEGKVNEDHEEEEKIWCSSCEEYSMIEVGNVIDCQNEECKNWCYSSS